MRDRGNGTARAGARCAAGPMLSIWLSFGEMPQKSTKTRTSMTMLSCDAMGSWAMLSAYAKPDTANMAENVSAKSSSMGASGDARGTYRETIRRPQKNKTTTPRPREGREGERREDGEPRHLDGVLRQKIREAVELHARARRRLAPEDGAVAAEDAERREGRREAHAEVQHEEERLRVLEPGREKGGSTSLQRECSARARSGNSIHASRPFREMIARPKVSRNEWKTAEI